MYVTCVDAHEGKRTLDPQEQGLQKVMSHPTWVLGSEPESSGRAASSPSSPALALSSPPSLFSGMLGLQAQTTIPGLNDSFLLL